MKRPTLLLMLVILASIFLFFLLNLLLGSVHIPFRSVWNILWGNTDESIIWQNIIWKSRVPQALTALVAGAGLSVSGLQMQTVFRNPLAGPSVLGISSGASLGVACVVLLSGAMGGVALSKLGYMGEVALSIAAIIGALSVMALIVYVSQKVKGNVTLLIIGVDMVINLCHGKTRQFMLVLADVILLFALVLFTISGWNYTVAQIPHLGTTIKVSLALFYAALPVSGLIMIYYTFVQLLENICYGEAKKIPLPGDEE